MIILLILLMLVLVFYICIKKDLLNANVYFLGIWFLSLFLAKLHLYNMMDISKKSILIIGIGLLGFVCGNTSVFRNKQSIKLEPVIIQEKNNYVFNKTIIYIILIVSLLFNIFMSMTVVSLLKSGVSYSLIRDALYGYSGINETIFKSTFSNTFFSWIDMPFTYVIVPIALTSIFERKYNRLFLVLCVIDIILFTFATSGRMLIFTIVVQLFLLLKYYKINVSKKTLKQIQKLIIFSIIVLIVITVMRQKESSGIDSQVSSYYSYFSINVPLMSYWVDYVDQYGIKSYGNAFFKGILALINFFLNKLDISTPLYIYTDQIINLTQSNWIEIFPKNWYNAYVSLFFYFYIDFGIPGVFIGSLVYGKIANYTYRHACIKREKKYLLVYLVLIQTMISSTMRWQLGSSTYILTIFLIMLCLRKIKAKN